MPGQETALNGMAKALFGAAVVAAFFVGRASAPDTPSSPTPGLPSAPIDVETGPPALVPPIAGGWEHRSIAVRAQCGVLGGDVHALVQIKTTAEEPYGDPSDEAVQRMRHVASGLGREEADNDAYDIRCALRKGAECTVHRIEVHNLNYGWLGALTVTDHPGFRVTSYDGTTVILGQRYPERPGMRAHDRAFAINLVAKKVLLIERGELGYSGEGDCSEPRATK